MDGHPLSRLALVLIFLALMAWPVLSLTRSQPEPAAEPAVVAPSARPVEQKVNFTITLSQPGTVEIRRFNEVIIAANAPVTVLEKEVVLPASKSELTVRFNWSASAVSHAGRVVLAQDGEVLKDQTFWGETEAEDIMTVTIPEL